MKYLGYNEAKEYVQKLNFQSVKEWRIYKKSKDFPKFLRKQVYLYENFEGYPIFLGYIKMNRISSKRKSLLPFNEAKEYVQKLNLKSKNEWEEYKNSKDFPNFLYKNLTYYFEFDGLADFLGYYSNRSSTYLLNGEFIYFLQLNTKLRKEWGKWYMGNKPTDSNYDNWLKNNKIKYTRYYNYEKCISIIASIDFKNKKQFDVWFENINNDINIPKAPDYIYRDKGWVNWDFFLNVEIPSARIRKFISYNEAKEFLKDKDLQNYNDYVEFVKENKFHFLPLRPDYAYRKTKEWDGYVNFLSKDGSDRQSFGERQIEKILKENNIEYIKEHKFKSCKNIKPLLFDFYLPNKNLCIEYDGELHFKSDNFFGGDQTLERIQKNDDIKNDWCLGNDINLLRISYLKKGKIKDILNNVLKLHINVI